MTIDSLNTIDESNVWYLLLYYSVPLFNSHETMQGHFQIVNDACVPCGIVVEPIQIKFEPSIIMNPQYRYMFRFPNYDRNDSQAIRLTEAFIFSFAVFGPSLNLISPHDGYVLRLPKSIVTSGEPLLYKMLVELEHRRDPTQRTLQFPDTAIFFHHSTTSDSYEAAWKLVPYLMVRDDLFNAARFWKATQDDFSVFEGEIPEMLNYANAPPPSQHDQTRYENALLNAFKTVEAIIGDPSKDNRKFFSRIRSVGLDPHERVGYKIKEELHSVIRKMNRARDRKTAHGSTRNRTITLGEILDFYSCAQYVISCAMENELNKPLHSS